MVLLDVKDGVLLLRVHGTLNACEAIDGARI